MITIQRDQIKEDKISCVIMMDNRFYLKSQIRIMEGLCNCGQLIEHRQELKFKEVTGHCFSCHPKGDFWGDTTKCKSFSVMQLAVDFEKVIKELEMFPRTEIRFNPYSDRYEVYYSYNRARLFCLIEHGVDIGYPQANT